MNPWILLIVAGLLEVVWATTLKMTAGWTKLWPSMLTLAAMFASFFLLARAMEKLPAGTSYAVWVGIGAVGTVVAAAVLYKERLAVPQVVCIALVVIGIVGLKAGSPAAASP
jgi:quaternary ammonium compound-resistance protein SugE